MYNLAELVSESNTCKCRHDGWRLSKFNLMIKHLKSLSFFSMENSFMTAMLCFNSSFLLKQFNPISQGKGLKMVLNKKGKKWLFPETCIKDHKFFLEPQKCFIQKTRIRNNNYHQCIFLAIIFWYSECTGKIAKSPILAVF